MSKFIDALECRLTGREFIKKIPLKAFLDEVPNPTFSTTKEYRFSIIWEVRLRGSEKDLQRMKRNVVDEIRRVVYGDLNDLVCELERAIFEGDEEKMMEQIAAIKREILGLTE